MRNFILLFIVFLCSCGAYKSAEYERPHTPTPIRGLQDADDDGIPDAKDQCAGTPKGVAVDMRGCPKDTDGDGVPDYLDQQLITPTECQPTDTLGVGQCPPRKK